MPTACEILINSRLSAASCHQNISGLSKQHKYIIGQGRANLQRYWEARALPTGRIRNVRLVLQIPLALKLAQDEREREREYHRARNCVPSYKRKRNEFRMRGTSVTFKKSLGISAISLN